MTNLHRLNGRYIDHISSYSNYGGIPVKAEYCHEAVGDILL